VTEEGSKRPSPWVAAKDELKIRVHANSHADLVANLTPNRQHIRLGFMIQGRETTVALPLHVAIDFMDQVRALIAEKGKP